MKLRQIFVVAVIINISILCQGPCYDYELKESYSKEEKKLFFNLKNYKFKQVGEGGQAQVLIGKKSNEESIAIKLYGKSDQAGNKDELKVLREITCTDKFDAKKNTDCVNLVTLKGIGFKKKFSKSFLYNYKKYSEKKFIIVLDYYDYNLNKLIHSEDVSKLPYEQILIDILKGLSCLHKVKYIHKDIKPENILLNKKYQAFIADYGLLDRNELDKSFGGTLPYVAPEVLKEKSNFDSTVDVYSFGILVFEMLYGKTPLHLYLKKNPSIRYGYEFQEAAIEVFENINSWFPKNGEKINFKFNIKFVLQKFVLVHPLFRITSALLKKVFELNFTPDDATEFTKILKKRFTIYKSEIEAIDKTQVDKIKKKLQTFLNTVVKLISLKHKKSLRKK